MGGDHIYDMIILSWLLLMVSWSSNDEAFDSNHQEDPVPTDWLRMFGMHHSVCVEYQICQPQVMIFTQGSSQFRGPGEVFLGDPCDLSCSPVVGLLMTSSRWIVTGARPRFGHRPRHHGYGQTQPAGFEHRGARNGVVFQVPGTFLKEYWNSLIRLPFINIDYLWIPVIIAMCNFTHYLCC